MVNPCDKLALLNRGQLLSSLFGLKHQYDTRLINKNNYTIYYYLLFSIIHNSPVFRIQSSQGFPDHSPALVHTYQQQLTWLIVHCSIPLSACWQSPLHPWASSQRDQIQCHQGSTLLTKGK